MGYVCKLMAISHRSNTSSLQYIRPQLQEFGEFHCGTDNFTASGTIIICRLEMKMSSHENNTEAQQLGSIFRFQNTHMHEPILKEF